MRRRNKVLAFVLAILMVIGMLPLSVFAAAGDTASDSSDPKPQTREEWVAAQGGTMLFGSSFDNPEKISGGKAYSEEGNGTGVMSNVNATKDGAKSAVENGGVHLTSGSSTGDLYPTLSLDTTNGSPVTFELKMLFYKPMVNTGTDAIFYIVDDVTLGKNPRVGGTPLYYVALENTEDGTPRAALALNYYAGVKNNAAVWKYLHLAEFTMGEEVSVKITFDPASKRIAGYDGDGNYVGSTTHYDGSYYNIDLPEKASVQTQDYPSFDTTQWVQIAGQTNQDFYINELYVYEGVSQPYKTEYSATGAGALTGFMKYLRENDAKHIAYMDFDDVATYGLAANVDEATGLKKYSIGANSYLHSNHAIPSVMVSQRKSPSNHTIESELKDGDLNQFFRIQTTGKSDDTYVDIYGNRGTNYMTKHANDETIVIQASFRKSYATDALSFSLFNLRNRDYYHTYEQFAGADTPDDTSDDRYVRAWATKDGNVVTDENGKGQFPSENSCNIGMLSIDASGYICHGGTSLGKKLKVNAFTDVAVILDVKNNKYSIAIDGEVVKSDITLLKEDQINNYKNQYQMVHVNGEKHTDDYGERDVFTKDTSREWTTGMYSPNECRIAASRSNGVNGHLDIDNWYIYSGADVSADNLYVSTNNIVGEPETWEQTFDGYWRYYGADGKPVTGKQVIGDKTYYFTDDGYFATVQREYLVSFDGVTIDGGSEISSAISASTDVKFGWKNSALWTDIFYDGAPGDEKITGDINGDGDVEDTEETVSPSPYFYGNSSVTISANSPAVNPKFKRSLTANEITDYEYTGSDYTVFDFSEYAGLEIDWYVDKAVDMHFKSIWYAPVQNDKVDGAKYGKFDKTLYNTKDGTNGWHSTILDLTNEFAMMNGAQKEVQSFRLGNVANFQLKAGWDNCNGGNYLNDVKIYIGRIDLVKYVPAKLDVSPATLTNIRQVDGKTVIYADNMSEPSKGWVSIGTDKYFCTPDGVAQTGAVKIGEIVYAFDDNGKNIGNADGIYTINGKKYYYANGVAKVGTYEVTVEGKQVTINTKGDGEIERIDGALPDISIGSYLAPDYDTLLSGKKVLAKLDFDSLPTEEPEYFAPYVKDGAFHYTKYSGNVPYIGNACAEQEKIIGTQDNDLIGEIKWYLRRAQFHYVADEANDVALKTYNDSLYPNTYGDININENMVAYNEEKPYKNLVSEASFKLGEDWNATATIFMVFDRSANSSTNDRNQQAGAAVTIDQYGYVKFGDVMLWKLSTKEYTRISLVHDDGLGTNGSLLLYINGIKVYTHTITNANFDAPTKVRIASYGGNNPGHGSLYIDDIYVYEGTTPVAVDTTTELKNGIVIEGGVKRYFQNGAAKVGVFTVKEGGVHKIYGFYRTNGLPINGFDTRYYFIDGVAQLHQGVVTIDGVDYYFGPDYKVVHNKNIVNHLDPSKSYTTDATGAIIKTDLFNDKTVTSADEIANNKSYMGNITESGKLYFDTILGANAFKTARRDHGITLFRVEDGLDLNDYDFLNFKVYVNEALKNASFGIVIGTDLTYRKVTGYNSDTNRYQGVIEGSDVYSLAWDETTQTGYKEVDSSKIYVKYNAGTPDYTDVYARHWDYTSPIYNFNGRTGWIDISISLKDFGQKYIDAAESIVLVTSGWNMNSGLSESENLSIAEASLSTFEETYETLAGWIDGRFYENGFVKTGWLNYEGTWYYLDPTTGRKTMGVARLPEQTVARSTGNYYYYEFNDAGVCQGKADGLIDGTSWIYDTENKVYKQTAAVKRIIKDGVLVTGIQIVDGNKYYVDPNTNAVVTNSSLYVNGELINTDKNGVITEVFSEWVVVGDNVYYYDASGKLASGYTNVAKDKDGNEGGYYYFDENTNVMLKSSWRTVYDNNKMFFGADGKAADGIIKDEALAGALENTGYFVDGVPVTTEITDGTYKYIFINGMLDTKVPIDSASPEILIWIIKDGVKNSFYFPVNDDKSFEKTFSAYACYELAIYDVSSGTPVKLEITDNKLVIAAGSTSHTYEVRYTPVEHTYPATPNKTVAAGCATKGYNEYVCKECGNVKTEEIAATGNHAYGEWTTVKYANCTEEGLKIRACDCGAVESEIIPRNNVHLFSEYDTINPATCTTAGYASGICERCGERMDDVVVIPALGHNYNGVTWELDVKATCVSKGTEKGLCTNGCGTTLYRDVEIDPVYHKHGINGTITNQADERDHFVLFKTVKASTCQKAGLGIFRCLDCGGFIGDEDDRNSLVVLDLDPENHEREWGAEYLVIFNEKGEIIETVTGASRAEMIEKSKYICGYNGAWRRDCTNPNCLYEEKDGTTVRRYDTVGLINGNAAHTIDLDPTKLFTTTDVDKNDNKVDPLVGMHYYKCTKCERAIQAVPHEMTRYEISADGTKHVVYCKAGCIIENADDVNCGNPYSETEKCEFKFGQVERDGAVVGHGDICKCGYIKNEVLHADITLTTNYSATEHWSECKDCGYKTPATAHKIEHHDAQTATCWQIGWDPYDECMDGCGYGKKPNVIHNQYPHNISANAEYKTDEFGHWYGCDNHYMINGVSVPCTAYKHLYEAHDMIHILASDPTCDKGGTVEHWECSKCGWYDETRYHDGVVIDKLGHDWIPVGDKDYDDNEHWQYCNRVGCVAVNRGYHTYKTNTNLENYDDENGTAVHKCDICEHRKELTGLATWYGVLGNPDKNIEVKKEGTDYYLYINGVKKTNYLAELSDGSFRYFDNEGKLVMNVESYGDKQFNSITAFGPAGLTNLIAAITYEGTDIRVYHAYTDNDMQAAKRGAIKDAILNTSLGIMFIKNGELQTGWQKLTVTFDNEDAADNEDRWYYFNSKLNDVLVNADTREGVLVKSTSLTIKAPSFVNKDVVMDIVNVRADGSLLLGVVPNGDGTASLYLDGTAGKMPAGWVTDTYTGDTAKEYLIRNDRTLASGKYVLAPGGVYWNFDENSYLRAPEHCRNEITPDGVYINAEGKAASNELVKIDATGKTYFIVMTDNVQSVYKEKAFVLAGNTYYVVDTETGEIGDVFTGWVDDDSYAYQGALQVSTFRKIDSASYYFDGAGNKIVSKIVYIKSVTDGEAGFAWSFDENGVATMVNNTWVQFIGEDGLVIADKKGWYFDTSKGLAYGLQDSSVDTANDPSAIYIFDDNGFLIVNVAEHDYNGVIYVIDENGKAKVKTDEDDE